MRRNFIIVAGILVVGVVGYLLLRQFSSGEISQNSGTQGQYGSLPSTGAFAGGSQNGGSAGVASGQAAQGDSQNALLAVIDANPVLAYFPAASGTVFAVRPDGGVVAFANGGVSILSTSSFSNVSDAVFSHDGRKVVVMSGYPQNVKASVFDVSLRTWTQLPAGASLPSWSPLDYRLAYLRDNGDGSVSLMTWDAAKAKPSPIMLTTLYVQDMSVQWANPNTIMLSSRPSAYANGSVLAFDMQRKTVAPVIVSRSGLDVIWSTSPFEGLSFSASQASRGGHLQLIDATGAVLQNFTFLTFPSKCAFAQAMMAASSSPATTSSTKPSTTTASLIKAAPYVFYTALYCGIPRDQNTLTYYPLPDAYNERQISTLDDIYRINISNGHIDPILVGSSQGFDVSDVRAVGNKIFFINRYDGKLYSVVASSQ